MSWTAPLLHDRLEFEEEETLARYKRLNRALRMYSTLSIALLVPSLAIFAIGYFSSPSPPYIYLVPAGVGGAFSFLSARTISRISEITNSDQVHHIA